MASIVVIVDNILDDVKCFSPIYEGLSDIILLRNPNKENVIDVLKTHPKERLICIGHGTAFGLLSSNGSYIIDYSLVKYLKDREVVGIWCYANNFACLYGLTGFFTNMFISNPNEGIAHGFGLIPKETIDEQNRKFAIDVHGLIENNTPLIKWYNYLYDNGDTMFDFVDYNRGSSSYINEGKEIFLEKSSEKI